MSISLIGRLEEFSILRIIDLLYKEGVTGVLTVESSHNRGIICFEKGRIVYASREGSEGSLRRILVSDSEGEGPGDRIQETIEAISKWGSGSFKFESGLDKGLKID